MGREVLRHLIWQLDQAFQGKPEHSLLANLSSVTNQSLDQLPPSGGRTMRDLIIHCGSIKSMHANHAFGDASRTFWTAWDGEGLPSEASFEELLDWLERGHDEVSQSVSALEDDGELRVLRPTYWGAKWETRAIVDAIAIHDIYHAGEINHLRALLAQSAR